MSAPLTVAQTTQRYTTLCAKLAATGITPVDTLIVLEATGSYWILVATTLVERGYHVSVVNPGYPRASTADSHTPFPA